MLEQRIERVFTVQIHQTDGELFGVTANCVFIITFASNLTETEK